MNKKNYLIALSLIILTACKNNSGKESSTTNNLQIAQQNEAMIDHAANSQNSLDWAGVYEGTFNCKDCDGSKATITLRPDYTYLYKTASGEHKGIMFWSNDGNSVDLRFSAKKFKVGENRLIALNNEEQPLKDKNNNEISFPKKETAEVFEFDRGTTNEEVAEKIKKYLQNKYKEEIKNNFLTELDRRFSFYELDLNDDGKNEYFVQLNGPQNCGTGGCSFELLSNNFSLITTFTVSRPPFFRSSAKTNGWHDIIMYGEKDDSGSVKTYIHLQYDARKKSYPSNPTVVKQSTLAPSGHDMTLWYDEYGFARPFSF